ncbi:MAG: MIP/aquaporin family protein, partial [Sphingobacteriaceae bacterium]
MNNFCSELIGTMFLILLGNGVVANVVLSNTKGNNSGWIVITSGWALGVFAGVVIAGPYSGAHLNPAVSIALAIAGKFNWADVPMFIAAQFSGAMLGAFLVWLVYKDHFKVTQDSGLKAAVFCTAPAIKSNFSNMVSEVIGTFVLIFVIFYFTDVKMADSPVGMGS